MGSIGTGPTQTSGEDIQSMDFDIKSVGTINKYTQDKIDKVTSVYEKTSTVLQNNSNLLDGLDITNTTQVREQAEKMIEDFNLSSTQVRRPDCYTVAATISAMFDNMNIKNTIVIGAATSDNIPGRDVSQIRLPNHAWVKSQNRIYENFEAYGHKPVHRDSRVEIKKNKLFTL